MRRDDRQQTIAPPASCAADGARRRLAVAVLLAAAVLPYANSLHGEFHFDDGGQIVDNDKLGDLPALLRHFPPARWLTFTTFHVNVRLHGLGFMPGWHAVNIALHAGCVLALYGVLTLLRDAAPKPQARNPRRRSPDPRHRISDPTPAAAWPLLAAVVFAVHPLASEPVNYIQARSVTLYTLFTLLALAGTIMAHRGGTRGGRACGAAVAIASLGLASVSKEVGCFFALALPLLYLLLFAVPQVVNKRRFWLIAAIVVVAAGAAVVVWLSAGGAMEGMARRMRYGFWPYWWGQMIVFWRYVLRAVLPLPRMLSVDHEVAFRTYRLADGDVLVAFLCIVGFVLAPAVSLARRWPLGSFLLLGMLVGLMPYFVLPTLEMMVEYRFYLPLAFFCALAAMAIVRVFVRLRRWGDGQGRGRATAAKAGALACASGSPGGRSGFAAATALVVVLGAMTMVRNTAWRTDVSLWEDAVRKAPRKARAVNGLAWALLKDRHAPDPGRALLLAQRSFDRRFVDVPPVYNPYMVDTLAEAYYANGLYDAAIRLEEDVIRRMFIDRYFERQLEKFKTARERSRATTRTAVPSTGP